MKLRLIQQLRSHATSRGDRPAIQQIVPSGGAVATWRDLAARVDAISSALRARLPIGVTVMLCSTNRAEYTAAFLGVLDAEMTVFPVPPDIAGPELRSAAERCGAGTLIVIGQPALAGAEAFAGREPLTECAADAALHVRPSWTPRRHEGPALLLLSSGTTGQPKIVRRDGASLDAVSSSMVSAIGFTPADRVLAAVPLCHSYGMEHGLLAPTWAGSTVHLYDGFDLPAAMGDLTATDGSGATIFPGVPFMFETLCAADDEPRQLPALRRPYSAGGPLPRSIFEKFLGRFGVPVAQLYGATEIGSVIYNDPEVEPFDPSAVGRPMAGVSVAILDPAGPDVARPLPAGVEGHVAIRADSMLSAYLDGDPAPFLGGYFLTGDLGRLGTTGELTITGRIKLLIDVGGRKVNPLEVEQVLASHPAVAECVVVPMRVSQTLNRLKAVLTPAEPGRPPDRHDLRAFLRDRLSAYKVPRAFEVRSSLPRSAAGKLLRNLVEIEENQGAT